MTGRTFSIVLLVCSPALAGELRLEPPGAVLRGPNSSQQFVLNDIERGRAVADLAGEAKFVSSDPAVFVVSAAGRVTPSGNGKAKLKATAAGRVTEVEISVNGFAEPQALSFVNDIQPILTRSGCNAGACHGALAGKGGFKLSLRGYDHASDHFALTRQALGRRVDGTEPAASLLLKKATRQMPHGGGKRFAIDGEEYGLLKRWIEAGAIGPKDSEIELAKIEVFPKSAVLKPKQTLRTVVRATYADGRTVDVTKLARFSTTEESVAAVDEDGAVTVASSGETAIAVVFGTKVATATIAVPFANAVKEEAFTTAAKANFIDDKVLGKLALLQLPPADTCSDAEFIRRASLDSCGVLPKPDEVDKFVADPAKDKREKLIDALLDRPEFIDYWTTKWCDLFLVSTRKLPQQTMLGFHRKLRSAVSDNLGWDRLAHDILTASGSTLSNGGGAYFVQRKDVSDLAESTAITFLGTSITCARCHNHPLERWTQDQYWALANLFSRVGIKNGERAGELAIQTLPSGDALHLRTGKPVLPAPLDAAPLPLDSATDRRAYFADWLTKPENPFFAKAIVNRIWRNYLGRGLIEAEDDIRDTNPPTNPELLDALVADFVAAKFDTKHLMKRIMASATYQRSSKAKPGSEGDDRFYSRYLLRRLPAQVILDSYSDVTGVPTPFDTVSVGTSGGTAATALYPKGTRAQQLPDSLLVSQFLDSFGRAERSVTCSCETTTDSSVGQALHLNNGKTLNEKLKADGSLVQRWVKDGTSLNDAAVQLYRLALGRVPTAKESKAFEAVFGTQSKDDKLRKEAFEDLVWAVLTSNEFLFNH